MMTNRCESLLAQTKGKDGTTQPIEGLLFFFGSRDIDNLGESLLLANAFTEITILKEQIVAVQARCDYYKVRFDSNYYLIVRICRLQLVRIGPLCLHKLRSKRPELLLWLLSVTNKLLDLPKLHKRGKKNLGNLKRSGMISYIINSLFIVF